MSTSDPAPVEAQTERQTARLVSFSDGVLAVIITLMAFEVKAPAESSFRALQHSLPGLLIYVLSFSFIAIYWNNHHHLLRATTKLSGAVMWANLHLLFWLSLIPVATEWVGRYYEHTAPAALYAAVALASGVAYSLLTVAIVRTEGRHSAVATAMRRNLKGRSSLLAYTAAIAFSFVSPWIAYALMAAVALTWFLPDRRLAGSD